MGSNVEQWRDLVSAHFSSSQVETAMRVLRCESGGNPNALNSSSGASGLFQHLAKYWTERSTKAGIPGADIFDPVANVRVAAWLQKSGGWTHWTCY
jgi:soluble lytic murein transglycosylase-like protein